MRLVKSTAGCVDFALDSAKVASGVTATSYPDLASKDPIAGPVVEATTNRRSLVHRWSNPSPGSTDSQNTIREASS